MSSSIAIIYINQADMIYKEFLEAAVSYDKNLNLQEFLNDNDLIEAHLELYYDEIKSNPRTIFLVDIADRLIKTVMYQYLATKGMLLFDSRKSEWEDELIVLTDISLFSKVKVDPNYAAAERLDCDPNHIDKEFGLNYGKE